jgi:hypothetical protein
MLFLLVQRGVKHIYPHLLLDLLIPQGANIKKMHPCLERNTIMTTYPIVLKAQFQPQGTTHSFNIEEGDTESIDGFEHISTWLKSQWSKITSHKCPTCGAILEIPDGSLEAHLKKYQGEHAGKDTIVRAIYIHKGPEGPGSPPDIHIRPANDRTGIISIKEEVQMEENSNRNSDKNV